MKSVVIALGGNNVVEDTISEYIAATRHGGIGICIQAYLLDSGKLIGVDAVIDKDYEARLIAILLHSCRLKSWLGTIHHSKFRTISRT